jgi:hypothetical protein
VSLGGGACLVCVDLVHWVTLMPCLLTLLIASRVLGYEEGSAFAILGGGVLEVSPPSVFHRPGRCNIKTPLLCCTICVFFHSELILFSQPLPFAISG